MSAQKKISSRADQKLSELLKKGSTFLWNKEHYLGQFRGLKAGDPISAPDSKGKKRKGVVFKVGDRNRSALLRMVCIHFENPFDRAFHCFQEMTDFDKKG